MLIAKLKKIGLAVGVLTTVFGLSACRQDMHDNPKYKAYRDGGMRQLPDGTVARGSLELNPSAPKVTLVSAPVSPATPGTAAAGATPAPAAITGEDGFPFKLSENADKRKDELLEILKRGESRFNISCLPCHGKLGDGNGMIVQRGFRRPPSYHEPRLKAAPSSYFYDVMTNGFGAMSSYADQLTPEDRWKVVAYIRALQLSQRANVTELGDTDKKKIEEAATAKPENKGGEHGGASKSESAPAPPGGHGK